MSPSLIGAGQLRYLIPVIDLSNLGGRRTTQTKFLKYNVQGFEGIN